MARQGRNPRDSFLAKPFRTFRRQSEQPAILLIIINDRSVMRKLRDSSCSQRHLAQSSYRWIWYIIPNFCRGCSINCGEIFLLRSCISFVFSLFKMLLKLLMLFNYHLFFLRLLSLFAGWFLFRCFLWWFAFSKLKLAFLWFLIHICIYTSLFD